MHRIQAVCLGHKEEFIGNYQSIEQLEAQVLEKYRKYLTQINIKEFRVPFILAIKNEQTGTEEILKDINVIPKNNKRWFKMHVKRIWDTCCVCISPFGITSDQLPCECPTEDCSYQYCVKCVQSIKTSNNKNNGQFYCLYCQKSSADDARVNELLMNLLWKKYSVKYGTELLSSINIMPGALSNDISSRIIHVQSLIQTLNGKINDDNSISELVQTLLGRGGTFIKELKLIKRDVDKLISINDDDDDDDALNRCFTTYLNVLDGSHGNTRICENFIEICELLLYYIQQAELKKTFPSLNEKINQWENTVLTSDLFEPKIIDVFKSLESDLGRNILPSVPCRIGLIGETNAGKTSLVLSLREIKDDYSTNFQLQELPDIILSSPIGAHKSTYCQLEFEHAYDNGTKVIFVDIEGSTDSDLQVISGNYFDQIKKADCDLYIIVFENNFTDVHRNWQEYIVNRLNRTCWIVRSKVDELFIRTFKQDVGQDFCTCDEITRNKYAEKVVHRVRQLGITDNSGRELSDIYLTTTASEGVRNQNISILPYAKFDLEKLIDELKNLPDSYHENRLQQMSICAVARTINICFRRGYALNTMKYNILAGIAAVIPFMDLIPRYFAREQIRQKFGVHTHSYLTKWSSGKTDEFQDYLKQFNIEIDGSYLKTSTLKHSFEPSSIANQEKVKHSPSIAVRAVAGVATAGAALSDDGLRAAGVGTTNVVRGLSVVVFVAGIALTAGMCAWSAVSNGKQMYDYLNRLCDDLIFVSGPLAMKMIRNNHEIRNQFLDKI
ncbi:unnamed protein product [Rotaria socialis]|uniref:G domain-containing protein n=2 Tax=Rotaria socialis TaxID=392032 RepID=A0A818WKX4_9BILA|nr:unnamed protein product [Rotaria socialis]CAF4229197.1 unnamed protein product [Rotaria socialis]